MRTLGLSIVLLFLSLSLGSCRKHHDITDDFQESTERGLKGIKDAQALQQRSRWQHPNDPVIKDAIEKYELGKMDVHTVVVTATSQPDELNNYTVTAQVNGETRSYTLSKADDGSWSVQPAGGS
ncbi:MAG: hypothetical protein ABI718_01885 [Acidobacteriota bacterium]